MFHGSLTLDGSGLVGVEHDVAHQGQLRGALAEGLDEPQHAQVMHQVHGVLRALMPSPPHTEALPDGSEVPKNRLLQTEKLPPGRFYWTPTSKGYWCCTCLKFQFKSSSSRVYLPSR